MIFRTRSAATSQYESMSYRYLTPLNRWRTQCSPAPLSAPVPEEDEAGPLRIPHAAHEMIRDSSITFHPSCEFDELSGSSAIDRRGKLGDMKMIYYQRIIYPEPLESRHVMPGMILL